jgi:hypothetical protein
MADQPTKWMIDTNSRYNKLVRSIISLATGSLVLPVLFLREFLGVDPHTALRPFLNCAAYVAWSCLAFSILSGLMYSWLSVKWVKSAWGQPTMLSSQLELLMDVSFVLTMLLFVVGVGAIVCFFVTVRAA